jgi:hypothetical protein
MTTLQQKAGAWLIPRLPFNLWVLRVNRLALNAAVAGMLGRVHRGWIRRRRALKAQRGLLANLGRGPFGLADRVNLDRFDNPGVTMRVDCRHNLPMGDASCRGIHVEHHFEPLEPTPERPRFLAQCLRGLEPGGCIDREQHGPYSPYTEARR